MGTKIICQEKHALICFSLVYPVAPNCTSINLTVVINLTAHVNSSM